MNLYDFCLALETHGLLSEGVKVGAVSPSVATWFKMTKDYKKAKSKPGFVQKETLHELSQKYGVTYNWVYQIVSKFS